MRKLYSYLKTLAAVVGLGFSLPAAAQQPTLDVTVSDITITDATFTIHPSTQDLNYYWAYDTKENFEAAGGSEGIIANRIAIWERNAGWYDNTTWQEMMSYSLVSGTVETSAKEEDSNGLVWNTEYVVYAFGMDAEGNVTAPLNVVEFKTLPCNVSENTFNVEIVSMEIDSAEGAKRQTVKTTVKVTPSNNDPYYVHMLEKRYTTSYDLTPGSAGETDFLANQVLRYAKGPWTGTQTFTYSSQRVGTEFCFVAVGKDEAPTTSPSLTFYTAEEKAAEPEVPFSIEISNVSQTNAHIKIVPPSEDMKYYWYITTPESIELHGGRDVVDIELDRGWYEYLSSLYNGTISWQEFMANDLITGTINGYIAEMEGCEELRWNTDYVVYAYGVDENYTRNTQLYFADFSTAERNVSDMTFEFELVSVEVDADHSYGNTTRHKVTVDIYPSNDEEQYAFNYHRTTILDQYGEDSMDEYAFSQFSRTSYKAVGPARVVMQDINERYDYYIVAMGWDEAPTTDVYKFQYNYQSTPTGVSDIATDAVSVKTSAGSVRIEGDYDHAAVYGLDGKVLGALRGNGAELSVPAGVYIVKYNVGSEQSVVKVIVK